MSPAMVDAWVEKSVEERFPDIDIREHVSSKDMWAGSHQPIKLIEYVVAANGEIRQEKIKYSQSLFKCFDESVVNALDHLVRMFGSAEEVTEIKLWFGRNGWITVRNNGKGVPTDWHAKANMYAPQLIFGEMFKGSSVRKSEKSIIGGTNGVGIKLANILSKEFSLETVYHSTFYRQNWHGNMSKVDPPQISETKSPQYTKITFLPDYEGVLKYQKFDEEEYKTLNGLFEFRAICAAVYAGWISPKCSVYYNDRPVGVKSMKDFASRMFPAAPTVETDIKSADGIGAANICVVIVKTAADKASKRAANNQISVVNGVAVTGGKHITNILNQIIKGVKEHIIKTLNNTSIKFQTSYVINNIFLFVNAKIPGIVWGNQRKDNVEYDSKNFRPEKLQPAFIGKLAALLQPIILDTIYAASAVIGAAPARQRAKSAAIGLDVKKYESARLAGTKDSTRCFLLLPEGVSAASMCRTGLTSFKELGFERFGYLTLRGVIMNVRKASTVSNEGRNIMLSQQLSQNEFFTAFLKVTGLNLNYKYDPGSPTYQHEIKQLRYGGIIGCVDQDHDGVGFIFSLIINIFDLFWPKLLEVGFVRRFATPIKRAMPRNGGKVFEFYSEYEYQAWAATHDESKYHIKYIKGLGTNNSIETVHLFSTFNQSTYQYYPDDKTREAYEALFGHDTDIRKKILSQPPKQPSSELLSAQRQQRRICATDHAIYEGEAHKRENLHRKLWHAIDGMNESGRKILNGAIKHFARSNEELRVSQLQGVISSSQCYHYGDAPLQEAIFGKALICVGGTQLPPLIPLGQFGSRAEGVDGHASPRYACTILNKRLVKVLYPEDDRPLLSYVYDDGKKVEPEYFVPIVPMAMLESIHCPADGWKIKVWARDVLHTIKQLRLIIGSYTGDESIPILTFEPEHRGFKGSFRMIRGNVHCFGNYVYSESNRTVYITELPLRVWHGKYVEMLKGSRAVYHTDSGAEIKIINNIYNNSDSNLNISIEIELAEPNGGYDPLEMILSHADGQWADAFEEYFHLHESMDDHLNMIALDGSVITFGRYGEILKYWFPVRKKFYERRVERKLILLDLQIRYLGNIIRYVETYRSLGITNIEEEVAEGILQTAKFDRFNKAVIERPQSVPTEELISRATHGSYDYLLLTTDRDKLTKAAAARQQTLEKLISERADYEKLAAMGRFRGAEIWLRELSALEEVILEGHKTNWMFEYASKFSY